jgi:hypothetical protein
MASIMEAGLGHEVAALSKYMMLIYPRTPEKQKFMRLL